MTRDRRDFRPRRRGGSLADRYRRRLLGTVIALPPDAAITITTFPQFLAALDRLAKAFAQLPAEAAQ